MPTHKHIRSSTANKRPTTAIADGQIALNTNAASPGLFFKDSAGATLIKVGPVHVGTTAPNVTPASGGSSGNSTGEIWLDTSLTPNGVKIWSGSAWVNATPIGSTTIQGLLELATNAETQAGSDTARAVTPAALQSKMSDSATTSSTTTIASSTAVKTAYDLANAALPKSGGTVTGALEIGTTGSLVFEGATADGFETTLAVVDPTADRTITLPNVTGTIVTTGDSGTVTSTMIANSTIVDADINASAAIAGTKISPNFGDQDITIGDKIIHNGDTNTAIRFPAADTVAIETAGSERLRIASDGNVGFQGAPETSDIGSTTTLSIVGTAPRIYAATTNTGNHIFACTATGAIMWFRSGTTAVGNISVTGSATAYNTSSDYRLKENVTPLTDGITRLQQLKPSRFNFIADPDTVVDGFLAHEVQDIVPEAITGEKDAVDDEGNPQYQGIDQSKIVPLLTAALLEAVAKIETLEQQVATLLP